MNSKQSIIGLDLGMGATKIWSTTGGSMVLSQVAVPAGRDIQLSALGLRARQKPVLVQNGTGRFLVGEGAHDAGQPIERLDYDRLTGSAEMRALVYGALATLPAEVLAQPLHLMVGLPLGLVVGDGARERVAAVKGWLVGDHHWAADKRELAVTVAGVGCVSQAHAAYTDWILGDSGLQVYRPQPADEIGVISVGFNTIEMLVLRANQPVARFAAGEQIGVRRYLELVNETHGGHYSLGELDTMLRRGALPRGTPGDLVDKWSSTVAGQIERTWGESARRFARVIVVGGGALLLKPRLEHIFGAAFGMPDDPVMAVAHGLYKLGIKTVRP
jgi:hypothetical protein